MNMSLTLSLNWMQKQAQDMDDDQRMVKCDNSGSGINFNIKAGDESKGVIFHGDQELDNNIIRQQLVDACKTQFNVKSFAQLPQSVKDAFKIGLLKDDLQLKTVDGVAEQVTSGRPLTARRIRAVISAVQSEITMHNTMNQYAQGIAWQKYQEDCIQRNKPTEKNLFDYMKNLAEMDVYTVKCFDDGVTVNTINAFARDLCRLEESHRKNTPEKIIASLAGGDGLVWNLAWIEMLLGNVSQTQLNELKDLVNSNQLLRHITELRDIVSNPESPDDAIHNANNQANMLALIRLAIGNLTDVAVREEN